MPSTTKMQPYYSISDSANATPTTTTQPHPQRQCYHTTNPTTQPHQRRRSCTTKNSATSPTIPMLPHRRCQHNPVDLYPITPTTTLPPTPSHWRQRYPTNDVVIPTTTRFPNDACGRRYHTDYDEAVPPYANATPPTRTTLPHQRGRACPTHERMSHQGRCYPTEDDDAIPPLRPCTLPPILPHLDVSVAATTDREKGQWVRYWALSKYVLD